MSAALQDFERRSRWVPWTFVGMFAVMLVANGIMVWFAIGSFSGLTTDQPYRRGLGFNEAIEANARQQASGWAPLIALKPLAGGKVRMELRVRHKDDATGQRILRPDRASITFRRPTSAGHDFRVDLKPGLGGVFTAEAVPPMPGLWNLEVTVFEGSKEFKWIRRTQLP